MPLKTCYWWYDIQRQAIWAEHDMNTFYTSIDRKRCMQTL